RPYDQVFVAFAGKEEASTLTVPKLFDHSIIQYNGFFEPTKFSCRFKQRDESFDQKSIIFEVSIELRDAVFPGAQQSAVFAEIENHKLRIASRGCSVIRTI